MYPQATQAIISVLCGSIDMACADAHEGYIHPLFFTCQSLYFRVAAQALMWKPLFTGS